jgi:hypothetical protein
LLLTLLAPEQQRRSVSQNQVHFETQSAVEPCRFALGSATATTTTATTTKQQQLQHATSTMLKISCKAITNFATGGNSTNAGMSAI